MNRRVFLASGVALLASFAAEAAGPRTDRAAMAVLSDGWSRARAERMPLLILVIPSDEAARWTRGQALGAWLNHGEKARPLVGSVVWVCASMAHLRMFMPDLGVRGEPWMVLVDPMGVPPEVQAIAPDVPEMPGGSDMDRAAFAAAEDAAVDGQIAALTAGLDAAMRAWGRGPRDLTAEARQVAVHRAADGLRAPPPGAAWANSWGCGVEIEGGEPSGIMCGMGHVPARATRFLYFYAEDEE